MVVYLDRNRNNRWIIVVLPFDQEAKMDTLMIMAEVGWIVLYIAT
jgi:hypothetical protein